MEFAYNVLKDVEFVIPKHSVPNAIIGLGLTISINNVSLVLIVTVTIVNKIWTYVLDAKLAIFFMTMYVFHAKINLKYLDALIVQVGTCA